MPAGRPRTPIDKQAPRSKRRHKDLENPKALVILEPVSPPEWLTTDAGKKIFRDLQLPLIEAGILQSLDIPNLSLMAQFWSDYSEARDQIKKTAKGIARYVKENGNDDLFKFMQESLKQYQSLLSKFAGSPIDRTRIVVRTQKKPSGVASIFAEGES